jgi:NhaA family Na+:H+ antiporter
MGDESSVLMRGWPIPCAADLAFGYFIARSIYRRHPALPFFLLLGIASDLLSLVIVELRQPFADGRLPGALLITAAVALAFVLRRRGVTHVWPYLLIAGGPSWWGFFLSGFPPALALVPIVPFLAHAGRDRQHRDIRADGRDGLSRFRRACRYPVQVVLLCFALVNAGAAFNGFGTGTWAIAFAGLAGKPAGVLVAIALAAACGLRLPEGVSWRELTGRLAERRRRRGCASSRALRETNTRSGTMTRSTHALSTPPAAERRQKCRSNDAHFRRRV